MPEYIATPLFTIAFIGALVGLLVLWFQAGMRKDAARAAWTLAGDELADRMDHTVVGPRYRIERQFGSSAWSIYARRHSRAHAPENFKRSTPPHVPVLEWRMVGWSYASEAAALARVKGFAESERIRWSDPVTTCYDKDAQITPCGDTV